MISGRTMVFGIFGCPVEHTFSPGMLNAAFWKLGMNACYVPYAVEPAQLREAVRAIVPLGIRGLNVTVPHKERVIPFLDDVTDDAGLIRAVNTIEVQGRRLIGHNTDGRGFLRSVREETSFRPKGRRVLIVGAGGAARSIAFSLALAGAGEVLLSDVDLKKARRLARDLQRGTKAGVGVVPPGGLRDHARDMDCIINATPLGLHQRDPLPFAKDLVREGHLICDLVYNPPVTPLLKAAGARGASTLSGMGMLLYQGVIAFEIWTGKKAPLDVMRKALVKQMPGRRK